MHGTSRSKTIPIEHCASYAESGLNMYGGAVVLDSRSDVVSGTLYNEEVAYADQRLRPDPSTARVVPWAEATGRMICDTVWDDGTPLGAAPRQVFRRVLERCRELGYEPLIGIEPEFYVLDRETRQPLFSGYHIFNTVRNSWVPLIQRIVDEMRAFGLDVITANCEYAGSQWEITYGPGRGLAGPDATFSFKNGVKELAHLDGYIATFMSKPFGDSAGCGAHSHITLLDLDGGENAMSDDGTEYGLSAVGRAFIAGQLRHARSTYALLAPTVNCLKRRRTHTFSPTNVSWGLEDRSALVRIKGGSATSRHVENRAPTGLSNPYLACRGPAGSGLARRGRRARARAAGAGAGRGGRVEGEAPGDGRGVAAAPGGGREARRPPGLGVRPGLHGHAPPRAPAVRRPRHGLGARGVPGALAGRPSSHGLGSRPLSRDS